MSVQIKSKIYPNFLSTPVLVSVPLYSTQTYSLPPISNPSDSDFSLTQSSTLPDWASWSSTTYTFSPTAPSDAGSYTFSLDFGLVAAEGYTGSFIGGLSASVAGFNQEFLLDLEVFAPEQTLRALWGEFQGDSLSLHFQ